MMGEGESAEIMGQPWKSGPFRAASRAYVAMAFRPRVPPGLKPPQFFSAQRGAEAPLFHRRDRHGRIRALLTLLAWFIVSVFTGYASAQVTFERLVNSAKEPQNWMTYSGD